MSLSLENLTIKQPIRRLEIQINNFNVAIPHHVNLLKRHKNNIKKYQDQHDWEQVRKEHVNVSRIVKQLKELLYQMDTLRAQVLDVDIGKFDKLTTNARSSIMSAIEEYLQMELNFSASPPMSPTSKENQPDEIQHPLDDRNIQLQVEQENLQRQQTCLHVWNRLQGDIQQLHELFTEFNKVVHDQKEMVDNMEDNIEDAQINVNEGAKHLQKASAYKVAAYPLAGAMLGTCIGGPIGLIAGLKIGGLAAVGCGILGFTGGSLLKKKQIESQKQEPCLNDSTIDLTSVKRSASCPDDLKQDKKHL
ncbi:PREDICTED: syntaxin-17 [Cyphomyrmex costatus]|uniref:Syntaxin-17 n=1 Tax=Cyphomyrmex costatus TaxID=456900 RepID=A0A195CUK9_9HYME|nr:PREDICTED: syntaxin-17 [Cyphomyrmex costatus]KYN04366.1 Syntaxin-17 [Cyphomyrmex costatus]